jgi:hypothetical protein
VFRNFGRGPQGGNPNHYRDEHVDSICSLLRTIEGKLEDFDGINFSNAVHKLGLHNIVSSKILKLLTCENRRWLYRKADFPLQAVANIIWSLTNYYVTNQSGGSGGSNSGGKNNRNSNADNDNQNVGQFSESTHLAMVVNKREEMRIAEVTKAKQQEKEKQEKENAEAKKKESSTATDTNTSGSTTDSDKKTDADKPDTTTPIGPPALTSNLNLTDLVFVIDCSLDRVAQSLQKAQEKDYSSKSNGGKGNKGSDRKGWGKGGGRDGNSQGDENIAVASEIFGGFKPQEISNILWSMAKIDYLSEKAKMLDLQRKLASMNAEGDEGEDQEEENKEGKEKNLEDKTKDEKNEEKKVDSQKERQLQQLESELQSRLQLVCEICERIMVSKWKGFNSQEMSNVIWSIGKLLNDVSSVSSSVSASSSTSASSTTAAANLNLLPKSTSPEEAATVLSAPPAFIESTLKMVKKKLSVFKRSELVNVVWAATRMMGGKHYAVGDVLKSLLEDCVEQERGVEE